MKRFCVGLTGLLLAVPAAAEGDGNDCGGDAYSFAEVVSPKSGTRQRGPLVVVPETLCADLAGRQGYRIESLSTYVDRRGDGAGQPPPTGAARRRIGRPMRD
jgi:hypothetical protein